MIIHENDVVLIVGIRAANRGIVISCNNQRVENDLEEYGYHIEDADILDIPETPGIYAWRGHVTLDSGYYAGFEAVEPSTTYWGDWGRPTSQELEPLLRNI